MKFQAAYAYLKRGHAITLPEWGGFWSWEEYEQTIFMHLRNGDVMELTDTPDLDYTLSFMFRDDWEILRDVSETEHVQNAQAARNEDTRAFSMLKEAMEELATLIEESAAEEGPEDPEPEPECSCSSCEVDRAIEDFARAVATRDGLIVRLY